MITIHYGVYVQYDYHTDVRHVQDEAEYGMYDDDVGFSFNTATTRDA
jgi:hypothetical protein